ncbi:MAG: PEP-CTERM sorting domain-containing protein [Rhodocyclaceae bacterium]|nr:PEP-CTERM sorting domain-containing protein [Rhodocyclaceae bacterium]MBX3671117.1 PEP-CTERM sorting domain-containing protein [Rhodocyclaceae bacterium]
MQTKQEITPFARRLGKLAAACAIALVASQANAELVTNGGFETGDLSGWTQFGNTGFTGVTTSSFYVHSGIDGAFFGPVGSTGGISQTLATTPGATYHIEFWLSNGGGTTTSFAWHWGGATPAPSFSNSGGFGMTQFTADLVATAATTTISFEFRQDPSFWGLDDVSVNQTGTPVPEPVSLGLLAAGGLAFAGARRRSRA